MATPTTWGAWNESSLTGDAPVDGVIYGSQWTSKTLSFSFPDADSYWSTDEATGYSQTTGDKEPWLPEYEALFPEDQAAIRTALQAWSNVSGLKFVEVDDNQTLVGDLRFAYTDTPDAQAWAYAPGDYVNGGDVWFGANGTSHSTAWDLGTYEYQTALHEIGHALGLKHPFATSPYNTTIVDTSWDTRSFTLMSYSAVAGDTSTYFSYEPTTPMLLDILAIQHLYGKNTTYRATNTTYTYNAGANYHQTIWDAGGIDTIRYVSAVGGSIDLNEGHGSQLGNTIYTQDQNSNNLGAVLNVWIAYDAIIENATGGSGNDTLVGNAVANVLDGGAGADTMSGGDGNDRYIVGGSGDKVTETNASASSGGIDTVWSSLAAYTLGANVENLRILSTGTASGTGNGLANTLYAGAGNNLLQGGSGSDTAAYLYASAGVSVSLALATAQATGGSGSDTLVSIENLGGSNHADRLTGNSSANRLGGGLGNDTLNGGAGADTLAGGGGNDVYYVDTALDQISETDASSSTGGVDFVYSSAGAFTLGANLENLRINTSAGANGTGNALNNIIYAGNGDNVLVGGSGTDIVSYAYAGAAVTVGLATTAAQSTGGSGRDTLSGFERLVGSLFDDRLGGSSAANTLSGGIGNDILTGNAGADTLSGGAGSDRFRFFRPTDGRDTITDFVSGQDKIAVVALNFGLDLGSAATLVVNGAPGTTAATFVYSSASGALAFDADGVGGDVAVQLAILSNKPATLVVGDFVLGS